MQPVKIVAGMSARGRITLCSDTFIATARLDKDGDISCETERLAPVTRFFLKNKRLPIPQLVRIVLLFADGIGKKGLLFSLLFLGSCVLVGMVTGLWLRANYPPPSPAAISVRAPSDQFLWVINVIIYIGGLLYINRRIATWHAAEHMAIAAYEETGSTDIQAITRASPVHDKCGSRFFLPLVAGSIIVELIAASFGISRTIIFLMILECMLWVDKLKGLDKLPGASHASRLLQRFVVTRQPGEREVRIAQRALQTLIAAHSAS
ncbi:MAG: DUF1385 domain-containing protein [Candidatus Magasanikbacteria bacterium]|nr:DUF1385 domain-containing protein [Candidatus Magasanikbacteria bacterium]